MQGILDFVIAHPLEVALPIVVAVLVNAAKKAFKVFFKQHQVGFRILPFLPIILGTLLGFLLTVYPMSARLMIGAALGGISHFIYKLIKTSLASKISIMKQMEKKNVNVTKVRADKILADRYRDSVAP